MSNKEILRAKFKEKYPDKNPINPKTNKPTKLYSDLMFDLGCKPHWMTNLSGFDKLVSDIDAGKLKAQTALEQVIKKAIMNENCHIGKRETLASKKKPYEEKYGIKF